MGSLSRYLIVGCGYVGARLARALAARAPVVGVTRRGASAAALEGRGIDARAWDLDTDGGPDGALGAPATVFYLVPPPATGARDTRLARFLAASTEPPQHLVYLSTTGVYGDTGGAEVGEDAPLAPTGERGLRRVEAEAQVRAYADALGVPWTIVRVPAIYGPNRLPTERLRRGEPMIRHSEAPPASRIHVDDLVEACLLIAESARARGRIYNVTDGNPASMTEYFERVATLTGLPAPTLVSRERAAEVVSPELWSFLRDARRIDSRRIREELGFDPRFKDLRLGILSSLPAP